MTTQSNLSRDKLSDAAMREDGMQPDRGRQEFDTRERRLTGREAKAGIELHSMRYVLGFGLGGAVIACLVVWLVMAVS